MFIGEIIGMVADSEVLNPNQLPDIEKVRPMLWGSFGSIRNIDEDETCTPMH